MNTIPRPNLSTRPLKMTCNDRINATPRAVYAAWTEHFDSWFAQAGSVVMVPEPRLRVMRKTGRWPFSF